MVVVTDRTTDRAHALSDNGKAMVLLSNHLLTLPAFESLKGVVVRINLAHVNDLNELELFLQRTHDIYLDYPKGRTKPPVPSLSFADAIDVVKKHFNIRYFATTVEDVSELAFICDVLPDHAQLVPKIETLKGVLNLAKMFATGKIKRIMLDSEDLYTDVMNDVELFVDLQRRVKRTCDEYNVQLLQLYGVVFA